ncbi:MAG: hypothetical protein U0R26_12060 [Solirubrobacterales bacterium]
MAAQLVAVAVALGVIALTFASSAEAASPEPAPAPTPNDGIDVTCVVYLAATGPANTAGIIPAEAESLGCYRSDQTARYTTQAAGVIIGQDWDGEQFTGDSLVWRADAGCTDNRGWEDGFIGDAWNNRASSAAGSSGCNKFNHFQKPQFEGLNIACGIIRACDSMGNMNNLTSSERWRHI